MSSLTAHLIKLTPHEITEATKHPFLTKAAASTLPVEQLKTWLGQDRLYAYSYVHFIAAMLSKFSVPTASTIGESLNGRLVKILIDCLTNIRREIGLFEDTASAEQWLDDICAAKPTIQTRAYQDMFAGATAPHRSLLASLVTLWATEYCYYTAWSHAAAQIPQDKPMSERDTMQRVFIPNWTAPEFKDFVDELGELVNDFAKHIGQDTHDWAEAECAWRQVLWAETQFWPVI